MTNNGHTVLASDTPTSVADAHHQQPQQQHGHHGHANHGGGDGAVKSIGSPMSPSCVDSSAVLVRQEKMTPIPKKKLVVLCIILINEAVSAMMLMPFVGLFVAHIQQSSPEEAGYVSGFLVGVFQLAQVFSGKMWGRASDVVGRKPAMAAGLVASSIATLVFGLSSSIPMAIASRLFHGLANGNVIVAKTVIGEITDSTNEAKGFAAVSFCWGAGSLFGPAIGGLLYDPCNNAALSGHFSCDGPFGRYPALLIALIAAGYGMLALLLCVAVMEETNAHALPLWALLPRRWRPLFAGGDAIPNHRLDRGAATRAFAPIPITTPEPSRSFTATPESDQVAFVNASPAASNQTPTLSPHGSCSSATLVRPHHGGVGDQQAIPAQPCQPAPPAAAAAAGPTKKIKPLTVVAILRSAAMRVAILLYMTIAAGDIVFWETFPLWGIASHSVGGIEASSSTVGFLIMMTFVPIMLANATFHFVLERVHRVTLWQGCMAAWALLSLAVPLTSAMEIRLQLPYLAAVLFVRQWVESWGYSLVFLFIARVSPREHLGTMNGAAQSGASIVRGVMPMVAAPLFAFSAHVGRPFPINHFLVFFVQAFFFVAAGGLTVGVDLTAPATTAHTGSGTGERGTLDEEEAAARDESAFTVVDFRFGALQLQHEEPVRHEVEEELDAWVAVGAMAPTDHGAAEDSPHAMVAHSVELVGGPDFDVAVAELEAVAAQRALET